MKILLGSANQAVIERWADLLSSDRTEEAKTHKEVRLRCAARTFDLILLHRSLVDLAAFSELRRAVPRGRFLLLSDLPSEEEGLAFLKAGIDGYGNTYMARERLVEASRVITGGGVWLGRKIVQRLIRDMAVRVPERAANENDRALKGLTNMERTVADMVATGMTNLEIAADLNITERTVKAHLTSIYMKTKTGNRLSLALLINR
ncbi:MAG: response regulator transcription factor [Syntrophales bacterium]|jgi:DNA-binding NarL/FixJ family response regulator|nr:response regulator transcription factor [Syntrophales bacterium]MCK9528043.1 response regulator transcription factor [Syntrophales bacterium]MDX9922362.1 response regulator transcription factor [Syntrophales bacterium]